MTSQALAQTEILVSKKSLSLQTLCMCAWRMIHWPDSGGPQQPLPYIATALRCSHTPATFYLHSFGTYTVPLASSLQFNVDCR